MANKLVIKYKGEQITTFEPEEKIQDLIDYLDIGLSEDERNDIEIVPESLKNIKESIVSDSENEWTIWSSSDLAEDDEQIPLVKIRKTADGDLEAVAIGDDNFDTESYKTAVASLKYSVGKPDKDRILRVDKSLNHSDPYLSTELRRLNIRANKGTKKEPISKIIGQDPKTVPDEPVENRKISNHIDYNGLTTLASQVLLSYRDELKALANKVKAKENPTTEETLVDAFQDMTGVNYYTEKIVDQEQYNYLLDLLGRSTDKYNETHVDPKDNDYVMRLKDLTEDLIEKVLLKQNPDYYTDNK